MKNTNKKITMDDLTVMVKRGVDETSKKKDSNDFKEDFRIMKENNRQ